jgi:hypothetical protein
MLSITCTGCSTAFYAPELPRRGAICFKCHVATVNLGLPMVKKISMGQQLGNVKTNKWLTLGQPV